jgi:hypothetical protein
MAIQQSKLAFSQIRLPLGLLYQSLCFLSLKIQFTDRVVNIPVYQGCSVRELLSRARLVARRISLLLRGNNQGLRIGTTFDHFDQGQYSYEGLNNSKDRNPKGGVGGQIRRPVFLSFSTLLLFSSGAALMHLALCVQDEPSPELETRLLSGLIGRLSAVCLCVSVWLTCHAFVLQGNGGNVSHKPLDVAGCQVGGLGAWSPYVALCRQSASRGRIGPQSDFRSNIEFSWEFNYALPAGLSIYGFIFQAPVGQSQSSLGLQRP